MRKVGITLEDVARGYRSALLRDSTFWDYIANGGGGGSLREQGNLLQKDAVRKFYLNHGAPGGGQMLEGAKGVLEGVERFGLALELAPRIGTYQAALREGITLDRTASKGLQVGQEVIYDRSRGLRAVGVEPVLGRGGEGRNRRAEVLEEGPGKGRNQQWKIRDVETGYESFVRAGELRRPVTSTEAAFMGREATVDFSPRGLGKMGGKGGVPADFMANSMMFFQAMVNAGDRLYRASFRDQESRLATITKIGLVSLFGTALHAINRDNPEYRDLPDWDKRSNWHWYISDGEGGFDHYRYPKVHEIGMLSSMAERFLDEFLDSDDPEQRNLGLDMVAILFNTFNLSLPVGADILDEQLNKVVRYTGEPWESPSMVGLEAWRRIRENGPEIYRLFGEAQQGRGWLDRATGDAIPDVSPARAEALMRQLFGQFAVYGARLIDGVGAKAVSDYPTPGEWPVDEWPGIRVVWEGKGKYSDALRKFYVAQHEMDQAYRTQQDALAKGDLRLALRSQLDPDAILHPQMQRYKRAVDSLNKTIKEQANLRRKGLISPSTETSRVKALKLDRTMLLRKINDWAAHGRMELRRGSRGAN